MSRLATGWSRLARHGLFAVALTAGLALRAAVMAGYPPAIWFGGDSASYLSTALRLAPATSRMSGYGVMLLILRPFHSFALVTAIQQLMGLAIAVMVYAVARRYRVPGWLATLAALPVLLDAYELQLEHEILPSVPFGLLVMAAITLLLWWRRDRPAWATVTAGLLLAISATFWPVGLPLLIVYLLYLIVRRAGWRRIGATALAGAVTLGAYALWFDLAYQSFAFTYSDGIYLWSRTMSFANCQVIKPPASEQVLCPHRPLAGRPSAGTFIWMPRSPLDRLASPKFSPASNALAQDFALRAIEAQPGGYAATVVRDVGMSFTWHRPVYPSLDIIQRYEFRYATRHWVSPSLSLAHGHTVASDQLAYGGTTTTRAVAPVAGWLVSYQRQVFLRGTVLAAILVIGLGGVARSVVSSRLRRLDGLGGAGLFPLAAAVVLLVVPVMTADFDLRYVLISVPVACTAAALAFARRPGQAAAGSEPGDAAGAQPAAAQPAGTQAAGAVPGVPAPAGAESQPAAPGAPAAAASGTTGPAGPAGPVPPLPRRHKDPATRAAPGDRQAGR